MKVVTTIEDLRSALDRERRASKSVGFVPTMGALHAGHLSLIERARRETDVVVLSIFVNPLQFGPLEDLSKYPRTFDADADAARSAGVDLLFAPSVEEMYPSGPLETRVSVAHISSGWEGVRRPGHFDGVATVVAKLFSIVGSGNAYFGEKDWQQLSVVRKMVRDLSIPVKVVGCPTIRERDGLALSSRNIYLSAEERHAALALWRAIEEARAAVAHGVEAPGDIADRALAILEAEPLVTPHYAAVIDDEFKTAESLEAASRIIVAAAVGPASLIDNAPLVG